jgi:hypothetical protein
MKILGIDQSLSKAAFIQFIDGDIVSKFISKTGSTKVKIKRRDTSYYDSLSEQIHHICIDLIEQVKIFNPEVISFESLSYGSVGDASRNLAELHGAMRETLISIGYIGEVIEYAPTSLKSYAWTFLPEDMKYEGLTSTNKLKKVKMDKKMVVLAARQIYGGDYLKDYNYSTGLDDLADATFLAHKYWTEYGKTKG